jgi:large repetitive protein
VRLRARYSALAAGALAVASLGLQVVPGSAASLGVGSMSLTSWKSAATVGCTSPGTQTLSATADTYVAQEAPTTNFGTQTVLRVRSQSGSRNMRTLVGFNLPALPSGCSVTSARLRLFATSASTGRTLQALRANASWAETTVTWNTQPATTGAAATVASATGWREWTVTTLLTAMYAGTNNGFLVRDAAESNGTQVTSVFSSRQASSNTPQLVVTFG